MKNIFRIKKYADKIIINPSSKKDQPIKKVHEKFNQACLYFLKNKRKK